MVKASLSLFVSDLARTLVEKAQY